jgi:hypothetical protein
MTAAPAPGAEIRSGTEISSGTGPGDWDPDRESAKTAYQVERIQLNHWLPGKFHDDRKDQGKKPIGFHIYGPCPSCWDDTSALCAVEYLAVDQDLETPNAEPERSKRQNRTGSTTVVTLLRCNCLQSHQGAPAGAGGCGTEWLLRVTYLPDEPEAHVDLDPVKVDEAFRYWLPAEDVTNAIPTALAAVQATAAKWQTALTALIAVLAISTVIGGESTIVALDATWKVWLAVAAAAAVLGNIIMLYFSDLASLGFPGLQGAERQRSLINTDLEPLKQVAKTVREIQIARAATVVAVAGALAATGIFLLVSPAAPNQESKLTVTITQQGSGTATTQTTGCGTVSIKGDKSQMYVEFKRDAKGAELVDYPLNEVTAIDAC